MPAAASATAIQGLPRSGTTAGGFAARSASARRTSSSITCSRVSAATTPAAMSASSSRRWPRRASRFASMAEGPAGGRARSSGTRTNPRAKAVISPASVQNTAMKRKAPGKGMKLYSCDRSRMRLPTPARKILARPGAFAWQTLKAFKAHQGLLLAGAVAYYALLSIVPLLILIAIALTQWIEPALLLEALERYLEWLIPGEADAIVKELANFLEHKQVIGWLLLGTMIFFSGLAFTVLENAMSVIFFHRVKERKRRFVISFLLPYCYVLSLGVGVLLVTLVSGSLQAMGERDIEFLGRAWSLGGISGVLLYLLGFA